ncbi:intracellular protein transport-like protein [Sporothrix schenckii 1099-18]|uniref:Intracellular protein transport-like protein n=1 Tax=Sporothrix schenckii 1099-18 TaxID=1397361 RepID=A0A0F2MF60_SPOSC|nr:intracellular protein transport-like protein [Sporothrix schenckii 1099-18]KJR86801.1 intracellular protein transport-like protein [Sporothrix schenckii 1099-18]
MRAPYKTITAPIMSLDTSSGRRTDLLFPVRSNYNGHGPSTAASASLPLSPLPSPSPSLVSSTSPSPFPAPIPFSTSESASSLVSASSNFSSIYPASSQHTPALSPSSSSNSIGDTPSSALDVDASVTDPSSLSSLFSSPLSLPAPRELDLSRRSSARPSPLPLKTAQRTADVNDHFVSNRGNSISINERRPQNLASDSAAGVTAQPTSDSPTPTASARTSVSVASAAPIRRKPVASSSSVHSSVNSVSLPAIVDRTASRPPPQFTPESEPVAHPDSESGLDLFDEYDQYSQYGDNAYHEQDSQQQPQPQPQPHPDPDPHQFAFDLESALDIDIDDFLPRPDQRFTRSGSVDSPTLYEFPKTPALFAAGSSASAAPASLTPSSLSKSSLHSHVSSSSLSSDKTVEGVVGNIELEHEQDVEDGIVEENEDIFRDDKESAKDKDGNKQSFAVALDSQSTDFQESRAIQESREFKGSETGFQSAAAGIVPSRNSSATTPAAPQTGPTTVSSQREQESTTTTTVTLGSSDRIRTEQLVSERESSKKSGDFKRESLQESESPVQDREASYDITQRNSTMSLFTRKTSPPHLRLGSISNTNPNGNSNHTTFHDNKEDNAQRSVSPDDRNSLYSVYDDEELQDKNIPIALPTISTSVVNVDSNTSPKTGNSETITTIVTNNNVNDVDSPNTLKPNNKSPSSAFKLGNFFGWPSASPSTTEFSDQSYSPLPSPSPSSLQPPPSTTFTHASTLSTPGTNSPSQAQDGFSAFGSTHTNTNKNRNLLGIIAPAKTNTAATKTGVESSAYYEDYLQNLQTPPILTPGARTAASPSSSTLSPHSLAQQQEQFGHIEEMEDELKAISAELAASIRREMDLEDLVDRLQTEVNNPQPTGSKRTSDYFSDSGAISSKFGDYDAAKEEIAQVQRRAEQEKAQIRLELTEKLTDERSRRRGLDQQIKELSERASGLDMDMRNNNDASGRVKQLESTCEDLRRRLSEERGVKENFEDLLSAMKSELQNASNERDNLRDEVVPQLRARVEGLESQAAEHARQIYETTKMQQELQSLKDENSGLRSAAAFSADAGASGSANLSRSNTVKGMPGGPPSKSATAANATTESREALAERLKDVEAQRDALHSALKSLLERQEFQNRENDKKIRVLELERQRLLTASPKKAGYERDVAGLRDEVSVLRRRAEEALEQKWQVEKGLSGLKMDLDRAEDEIAHLRTLLQQHDILLPSSSSSRSGSNTSSVYDTDDTAATSIGSLRAGPVTSASLETAYKNLQKSYADALERIRALESSSGALGSVIPSDEKTTLALQRLERSLSSTMAERDAARDEVATHLTRLADSAGSEKTMLENERSLAGQLDASARRVEELAQQVRTQLETNATLRDRLSQMVARGDADQKAHKSRIAGLEARLRSLEEQLVATQTAAEDRVARHEEQVAALKEAHNTQLQRLRDASGGIRASSPSRSPVTSPRMLSSTQLGGLGSLGGAIKSPMSPMFSVNGKLVPPPAASSSRPSSRGSVMSGGGASASGTAAAAAAAEEQQAQVATLKARVSELETALSKADSDMQEVVGRMNTAQIEVMQLQEDLETAGRETRRLQRLLETEKVKGFEERFKLLSRTTTA